MRRLTILIIIIINSNICLSQNIVRNPDFEQYNSSNNSILQIGVDSSKSELLTILGYDFNNTDKYIRDWIFIQSTRLSFEGVFKKNIDKSTNIGIINTPFINLNIIDTLLYLREKYPTKHKYPVDTIPKPYSGKVFIQNINPFLKNVFVSELKEPLVKGKKYNIEFFYLLNFDNTDIYSFKLSVLRGGRLGIHFTNINYTIGKNYKLFAEKNDLNIPIIRIWEIEKNSLGTWMKFSKVYTPLKTAKYIMIGNHSPFYYLYYDCGSIYEEMWQKRNAIKFYIDKITITEID